jgi:hypothetical protein
MNAAADLLITRLASRRSIKADVLVNCARIGFKP